MNEMERLNEWLDSVDAPKGDTRGWDYTTIGRIDAMFDKEKQALKQRLIDAAKKRAFTADRYYVVELDELFDIIERVFSEP